MAWKKLLTPGSGSALTPYVKPVTSLVPYVKPPVSLVKWGHKFVKPQDYQLSGMAPGTLEHTVIPKGTELFQFQPFGGNKGKWFSRKPIEPFASGLNPYGDTSVIANGPPGGLPPIELPNKSGVMFQESVMVSPKRKKNTKFVTLVNVPALQSTAAPITDTWSVKGLPVPTGGSAEQLLIAHNSLIGDRE